MARRRISVVRLAELMETGELHSRVIKDVAAIDRALDDIIAARLAAPERATPFTELILSKLATYTKVTIIDGLPYRRRPASLRHIETLKHLIHARNFLAHTHRLPPGALPARVQPWLYLLTDYPEVYEDHLRSVRRMLRSLLLTRSLVSSKSSSESGRGAQLPAPACAVPGRRKGAFIASEGWRLRANPPSRRPSP